MRLSDEKMSHLSHLVLKGILEEPQVDPLVDDLQILREIKRDMIHELQVEETVDDGVRKKLRSLSRHIPEGSAEWDVLYQKFFREEMARRGVYRGK